LDIKVVLGDITNQTGVDAALWLLHTGGGDYSGMADKALTAVEPRFHQGLIEAHGKGQFKKNKDTVLVNIPGSATGYEKVIFVGDDIWEDDCLELNEIITAGLVHADNEGIQSLAVIPFRTGRAAMMFNRDEQEQNLVRALKDFRPESLETVRIIVYGDQNQVDRLQRLVA
jgi:hypothetical protein